MPLVTTYNYVLSDCLKTTWMTHRLQILENENDLWWISDGIEFLTLCNMHSYMKF